MPSVTLTANPDGTWTATIFTTSRTGTYGECVAWLEAHGESRP